MKKIFSTIVALLIVSSLSFAQNATGAATPAPKPAAANKMEKKPMMKGDNMKGGNMKAGKMKKDAKPMTK